MKIIRFGAVDKEKPGVLLANGKRLDVSAFCNDFDEAFFGNNGIQPPWKMALILRMTRNE